MDSRFIYAESPIWKSGLKQALQGTELLTIQPASKSPTVYEFELPSNSVLLFGPLAGFIVKGNFQFKKKTDADSTYDSIPATTASTVSLQPNWFEHLIKDITIFHGNHAINVHDVPRNADAFINAYLYANMYKDTKKYLFPESQNPGHCVARVASEWSLSANSVWRKYAEKVFGDRTVAFRYIPPFLFPFYQQPNLCVDGRGPSALITPLMQKMTISLHFKDNFGNIFQAPADDVNQYRFKIQSIELVVEEARLNPAFEKRLLGEKKTIAYQGLSRFGMNENIPASVNSHRVRFQDIPMPEGIFICALPKDAIGGTYKCGAHTANVFSAHNIKSVDIMFNNIALNLKSPKMGDVREHMMEIKQFIDHFENPPFGVLQEPDAIVFDLIKEGGDSSIYPHVYINLTPSGKNTRAIPVGEDGSVINKNGDLDLQLSFSHGGATDNVTYLFYVFLSDVNLLFDMRSRTFVPMYKRSKQSY